MDVIMRTFDKLTILFLGTLIAGCSNNIPQEDFDTYLNVSPEYVVQAQNVTLDGRRVCNVKPKCTSDALLPHQPCSQPMPTYYQNITEPEIEKGVLLIHPYTRAKVLCLDYAGYGALQCAENYKHKGYILVTDIPQFTAKYDNLTRGTYPTRKWRNGGELNPRF